MSVTERAMAGGRIGPRTALWEPLLRMILGLHSFRTHGRRLELGRLSGASRARSERRG